MRIKRNTPPKVSFAGKIKIGEKRLSKNGKEYPASLDYFKMYCDQPEYIAAFNEVYGEKPSKLTILFPTDSESNIVSRYEMRSTASGKLAGYGDGETFFIVNKDESGFFELPYHSIIEKYQTLDNFFSKSAAHYKGIWKERLQLTFMLPELKHIFAFWRLETSAVASSIQQIESSYDTIKALAGTVRMIPFDLVVKKSKTDRVGAANSYSVISLIPNLSANNALKVREMIDGGTLDNFRGLITDNSINDIKLLGI